MGSRKIDNGVDAVPTVKQLKKMWTEFWEKSHRYAGNKKTEQKRKQMKTAIIVATAIILGITGCTPEGSSGPTDNSTSEVVITTLNVIDNNGDVYIAIDGGTININQEGKCIILLEDNSTRPCTSNEIELTDDTLGVALGNLQY